MNSAINRRELTFKALAGLAGGAIGWIPVELASHGHSLTQPLSTAAVYESYASMAILGGFIGGLILASDEQRLEFTPHVQSRFVRGFILCAALILPANYFANNLFTAFLNYGGWGPGHPGSMFFLVLGRIISWVLMGAMLGAGVGIAGFSSDIQKSVVNVGKGALGGAVGGFAGGFFFDFINQLTGGGLTSRLVGLALIGLAIGLVIGLVHELTKSAWVTVEAGRLKGRQYRLEGSVSSIGRAEENPVGLFGDPSVQARHAVIEHHGDDYVLRGLAVQEGTFVNGSRVESATLKDGDRIRLGSYELSFHLRQVPASASAAAVAPAPARPSAPPPSVAQAAPGPCLVDSEGNRFEVHPGQPTRIGRALDNDIVIAHSSVSRHHATIEQRDGAFELRDLASQNGTFVGQQRVSEAPLRDGDMVRLGEATLTFRA